MTEISLVSSVQKMIQDSIQAKATVKVNAAEQERVKDVENIVDKSNDLGKNVDVTV